MENYKRLPFAAYDLAVYIPGGVVFYVFISQLLSKYYPNVEIFSHIPVPDDTIGNVIRGIIGNYILDVLAA